jgi:hypothetical protein
MLASNDVQDATQGRSQNGRPAVKSYPVGRLRGIAVRRSASRPWSVRTNNICPVIGVFIDAWHEGLGEDERSLLDALVPSIVQTRATPRIEEARALMAADWLVRTYTPVWLNLAGLQQQARQLYDLPQITEASQVFKLRPVLAAVSHLANAEAVHVDEAGWIKASDDCWASAWAGAYEATRLAAHDSAWVSAAAAARAAAGLAAELTTDAFRTALQASAAELVLRMARCGSPASL